MSAMANQFSEEIGGERAIATDAEIYYTLDGSEPTTNSTRYTGPFTVDALGDVTIKAKAVMEDCFDSEVATFTFARLPYSAAECIGVPAASVTTGGDAQWFRVLGYAAHDGVAAMRSGAIGNSQTSYVEMTVNGAGELSFWWKISSQNKVRTNKHDYLGFSIDGIEVSTLGGGKIDWTNETCSVVGDGRHTLRWTYIKDADGNSANEDCAWLDEVVWTPAAVANVAVDGNKGEVSETTGGYVVTAKTGETLTDADFVFNVVPKEAYKVEIAEGGKAATVTLAEPVVGVALEADEETAKDEDDPSGLLVTVASEKIAAAPAPNAGESVGALPVKAYEGLYYQASWGDDLGNLVSGEKVRATGSSLYLGVIRQKGGKGFYKLTVSEK